MMIDESTADEDQEEQANAHPHTHTHNDTRSILVNNSVLYRYIQRKESKGKRREDLIA